MNILELLIALEEEGFPFVCRCEEEIIVAGNRQTVPPDLAREIRLNEEELMSRLRRYTRRQLEALRRPGGQT